MRLAQISRISPPCEPLEMSAVIASRAEADIPPPTLGHPLFMSSRVNEPADALPAKLADERQATLGQLAFEKAFQIRASLDDGSRSLLQLAVDPLEKWSPRLHMRALFQRDFVRKVAQLRVPVRDLLDFLPQERVLLSQLVVHRGRL